MSMEYYQDVSQLDLPGLETSELMGLVEIDMVSDFLSEASTSQKLTA